jgi:hypothetical protein
MPIKIPDLEVSIAHIFRLQSWAKHLQNFQVLMASYPFARPDLWIRISQCHIQHTTNEITIQEYILTTGGDRWQHT